MAVNVSYNSPCSSFLYVALNVVGSTIFLSPVDHQVCFQTRIMTLTKLPLAAVGDDRRILVAVDYGTTFSGVAWAQTARVSDNLDRHQPRSHFRFSLRCRRRSSSGQILAAL